MRKIIGAALLIFCFVATNAQDSNYVRQIIRQLSAPQMYGRSAAHSGDSVAALFIVNELQKNGAKPLITNYLQEFYHHTFAMEGVVKMAVDNQLLRPWHDFRITPYSPTTHATCPIIHSHYSVLINPKKLDRFCKKYGDNLANSLIFIDLAPVDRLAEADKKAVNFALSNLQKHNIFNSKGVLLGTNHLPIWGLSQNYFQRNYVLIYVKNGVIKKKNRQISLDFDNDFRYHKTQNVCAVMPGTAVPDSFIVLTAHYDHVGCMGDSVIFCGAHDNASGVATLLDFARHLQNNPPKYSVALLFFTGEEAGLLGSTYFVNHPLLPLENIKLLLNLDLQCGGNEGITIVNSQREPMKTFYDKLVATNEEHHYITAVKSRANSANSDHFPFTEMNVPAVFIYTLGGRNGGYHDLSDTCDSCGLENYNAIFSLLRTLIEN